MYGSGFCCCCLVLTPQAMQRDPPWPIQVSSFESPSGDLWHLESISLGSNSFFKSPHTLPLAPSFWPWWLFSTRDHAQTKRSAPKPLSSAPCLPYHLPPMQLHRIWLVVGHERIFVYFLIWLRKQPLELPGFPLCSIFFIKVKSTLFSHVTCFVIPHCRDRLPEIKRTVWSNVLKSQGSRLVWLLVGSFLQSSAMVCKLISCLTSNNSLVNYFKLCVLSSHHSLLLFSDFLKTIRLKWSYLYFGSLKLTQQATTNTE